MLLRSVNTVLLFSQLLSVTKISVATFLHYCCYFPSHASLRMGGHACFRLGCKFKCQYFGLGFLCWKGKPQIQLQRSLALALPIGWLITRPSPIAPGDDISVREVRPLTAFTSILQAFGTRTTFC